VTEGIRGCQAQNGGLSHPIMHYTPETLRETLQRMKAGHAVSINPSIMIPATAHLDLLPYLQYTPAQRDQGWAGNCWAWASTGVMEVSLDVQRGIKDRLSIQYLDSNYHGGTGCTWAGCGADLDDFTTFYSGVGYAIPWSNTNAAYADTYQCCNGPVTGGDCPCPTTLSCPCTGFQAGASVPYLSISTSPKYPFSSISDSWLYHPMLPQATAIANIKNILYQNKALYFAFTLPDAAAWTDFGNFWNNQLESVSYDMGKYNGATYNYNTGGGHAVLLVGFDDTNPSDRYWIMVNSWGTTSQRPNGIFHVKMDLNYDSQLYDPYYGSWFYNLWWGTLAIAWNPTMVQVTVASNPVGSGFVVVDGSLVTPPQVFSWVAGSTHTISAREASNVPFAGWSWGNGLSVSCAMYSAATVTVNGAGTVTANFGSPVSFDFRLSNSGASLNMGGVTVARGSSGPISVTVVLVNGPAQAVTLSCSQANGSPLPSGVSCSPASGTPPFTATVTVTVSSSALPGYYTIKLTGTAGGLTRQTLFMLHI